MFFCHYRVFSFIVPISTFISLIHLNEYLLCSRHFCISVQTMNICGWFPVRFSISVGFDLIKLLQRSWNLSGNVCSSCWELSSMLLCETGAVALSLCTLHLPCFVWLNTEQREVCSSVENKSGKYRGQRYMNNIMSYLGASSRDRRESWVSSNICCTHAEKEHILELHGGGVKSVTN